MNSRMLSYGFIVLASLVIGVAGCKDNSMSDPYKATPPATPPPANTVVMSGSSFSPAHITVPIGTTITWRNSDGVVHTSTSDTPGLWDTGNVPAGSSKTTTFMTAGTFTFRCIYHASMGMTGTITVQ